MLNILLGSILISLVHAAIPSHWLPLVVVGRAQRWTQGETLRATVLAGLAHTISTTAIGVLIALAGLKLTHEFEETSTFTAPMVLILLGMVFIVLDLRHHRHREIKVETFEKKSRAAVIASLSLAMFFSPCMELSAVYLQAGTFGGAAIVAITAIYLFVTVLGMVVLVYLGMRGVERVRWHFLEKHEKAVSGIVLVALGLVTLLTGGHSH